MIHWRNGELQQGVPTTTLFDSAMMYGDSVFEMMRTFNGETFRLGEHVARLLGSAKLCGFGLRYLSTEIEIAHESLLALCKIEQPDVEEWRTMITASRGPLPLYAPILEPQPWVTICAYPLAWVVAPQAQLYDGVAVVTSDVPVPDEAAIPPGAKHHSRLHFRLAEASAGLGRWPLLLARDGSIAEATGANLFAAIGDTVFTPRELCLQGISRAFVLEICQRLGIRAREARLFPSQVSASSEAFLTCTPLCIVPCTSLDGRNVGTGAPGPMTARLTDAWARAVGCDFREQARSWACSPA